MFMSYILLQTGCELIEMKCEFGEVWYKYAIIVHWANFYGDQPRNDIKLL